MGWAETMVQSCDAQPGHVPGHDALGHAGGRAPGGIEVPESPDPNLQIAQVSELD
jgi:hypothetical protein